jgi:hypothetical protein
VTRVDGVNADDQAGRAVSAPRPAYGNLRP